jgi:hypothetical protein
VLVLAAHLTEPPVAYTASGAKQPRLPRHIPIYRGGAQGDEPLAGLTATLVNKCIEMYPNHLSSNAACSLQSTCGGVVDTTKARQLMEKRQSVRAPLDDA